MTRRAGWLLALTLVGSAGADQVYRVRVGDSLFTLARRSGTTVQALQQLNDLSGSLLRVGQAIKLPGGPAKVAGNASGPQTTPTADSPAASSPAAALAPVYQSGMAVYYPGRADRRTVLTAAHLSLPFGTWVEVTHARTGRSVLVLINDRGPFGRSERVIDLSAAAAQVLGIMGEGVAPVSLRVARRP